MSALKFSLIQTSLHWEDKEANLEMLRKKIETIEHTHVIVLPEMFTTGFTMKPELVAEQMDGATMQWMRKLANEKKVIVTGSIVVEENNNFYNRLLWVQPDGKYGYYDKRHLFAYGKEDQHYASGERRFITSVNGWKINLMICYDLRFPVWSRQQYQQVEGQEYEYDVLIYMANWPDKRKHAWKTLLQARAIENQCYVIGVNRVGQDANNLDYSGDSMAVNALGEVLYHKEHDEDIFTVTLDKKHLSEVREKLPFWREADPFFLINPGEMNG
jgi:predicted amidohydrolase